MLPIETLQERLVGLHHGGLLQAAQQGPLRQVRDSS